MSIPVIDLFAGPGGLSEGFSSLTDTENSPVFKIKLSIEKDYYAHETLELRAFFRQFPKGEAPRDYYEYVKGNLTRNELFARYPAQAKASCEEAWRGELGTASAPNRIVDKRIKTALNGEDQWVLIGGPPCQTHSLVGRSRMRGESVEKFEKDHRHFLYREYLRILAEHAPAVFVMENVKGLLSSTVKKKSIFDQIRSDLANPGDAIDKKGNRKNLHYNLVPVVNPAGNLLGEFRPEDFVVRTERYGIPQARHRVIILGVRSDIAKTPGVLVPSPAVSIYEVIRDLPKLRSGLSKRKDSSDSWRNAVTSMLKEKWFSNGIDPEMRQALTVATHQLKGHLTRGQEYIPSDKRPVALPHWFFDPSLRGVLNHVTRGHMLEDLHRYLFASVFAENKDRSPLLQDLPRALLPKHKNIPEALENHKFNDRFRVQIKGRPATTVTSHIHKDGHAFIHYDPKQCRSLTVREAARLQTFPDNYFFEGPRTEQYKQVGNAVPPLLANQIAEVVADLLA